MTVLEEEITMKERFSVGRGENDCKAFGYLRVFMSFMV